MKNAADIDVGPLTWVKGEIDLAFDRTLEALEKQLNEGADGKYLRTARTQLHQVHGALSIVGFDGVTRFAEAIEQVLEAVDEERVVFDRPVFDTIRHAIATVRNYLEDLIVGRPDQPLRLFPAYQTLTQLAGQGEPAPSDLFFPDISQRPPARIDETPVLDPDTVVKKAKAARLAYERGLLKLLKKDPRGIDEMRNAIAIIESCLSQPGVRAFWWVALGFMDTLAAGFDGLDLGARRVCARIDTQMKRFIEGSRTVAERLMRNALYYVAVGKADSEHATRVRAVYRLAEQLPSPTDMADIEPLRPVLRTCRELLASAMDDWNKFCAGTAVALPQFHDSIRQLGTHSKALDNKEITQLADAVLATADELRRNPLAHNDSLALEVATSLLLFDHVLGAFPRLSHELAEQVEVVSERLSAAIAGKPLGTLEVPHLDEMSRHAQERLLLGQVAKEIIANLGLAEHALDAYFRDQGKADELESVAKPLKQIEGALSILNESRAVEVLRECEQAILGFGDTSSPEAKQEAFESVASKLSALGFFVERLQHGPADIDRYLNPSSAVEEVVTADVSAEEELERARRLTKTLIGALREQPQDQVLRGEIRQNLEVLRDNAELIENTELAEQASAAIVALENEQSSADIAAAVAQLAPVEVPTLPSVEAVRLAEASSEEVDAELLGIFIEEAQEVLETINSQLPILTGHPHDSETLTTIRRGFHTLKGSGRMVGLVDLGEAAWAVEQVLNRWLQQELAATKPLLSMIEQAHALFVQWVTQLETGGGLHLDASDLVATCEALKAEIAQQVVLPQAQAVVAPVEANVLPDSDIDRLAEAEEEPVEVSASEPLEETTEELEPAEFVEIVASDEEIFPDEGQAETPAIPESPSLTVVPPPSGVVNVGDVTLTATLYDLYIREAQGHIAIIERELGFGEQPRPSLIRAAHTLAGISATTGIAPVHSLAHALEMALNRLAEAATAPTEDQHLILARAVGALEGMVGAVTNKRAPETEDILTAALDALSPFRAATPPVETEELGVVDEPAVTAEPVVEVAQSVSPLPSVADFSPLPSLEEIEAQDRKHLSVVDELDDQLLPIFLEESTDLMRDIGTGLRAWREQPGDKGVADQLKRVLHTLKGSARMAGAMSVGELVHGMETRIEQAAALNALTPAFLDTLDASFDRVSALMDRLQNGETEVVAEQIEVPVSSVQSEQIVEAVPHLAEAPIPHVVAREESHHDVPEAEVSARNLLRVRADVVDKLVNEAGEIAIARGRIEGEMRSLKASLLDLTENVIRLRNQLREIEIQAELQMQSHQALAAESEQHFDPLEFDRFTRFQELTRMMAESVNDVATSQQSLLQNLDQADAAIIAQARLNREHSQALMNVRMVPFNTLTDRLYRVVRQTAKDLGKRANLDIRGGQTELDRSVLEKMTGPIEHLLRNAVAHGLETPEERRQAGKGEIGEILLRVGQEGNEIAIELSDDGQGLDYDRIRSRGRSAGLIAEGIEPTQEELTELIFQPGFSTADSVSAVSGRGVGMDVVRSEAANLGGRVRVESVYGKGSTFQIHLPLTLAVTQAVLVKSGARHYAIPSSMVAQVRELKPEAIAAVRSEGTIAWLGDQYAWQYLPRLLGASEAQPEPARRHWLLLLRAGGQRAAIEVDALIGNQELVVKNIGPQLARVVGIAGATVLGDGEIVLILNPLALVARNTPAAVSVAAPPVEPLEPKAEAVPVHSGLVMVVDDSLTVRKITGRLLAREGYHVLLAKDGVDALEQLIDIVPEVMLVDIEMPRMDGFDLTRNVRADERLKHIPIVMITSRIADKHRNYAREIGVNHYLGKPYDEDELLKIIAGYTGRDA